MQTPVREPNANARLEALCDGVFAIAMTLLVIELRTPDEGSIHSAADLWAALRHEAPTVGAFLLSFTIIFISRVNHHAVVRSVPRTSATFRRIRRRMVLRAPRLSKMQAGLTAEWTDELS